MSKFRKTLKKKVNPAKSNKMIVAVGVGVLIIFLTLFLLTTGPSSPKNKAEAMDKALKYVKKAEGILDIKTYPEKNRAVIIYDSWVKKTDFVAVARFAGIRMSDNMGNEEVTLVLSKDKEENEVHYFLLKGGNLLNEWEKTK
jgi:hypothetical protein